MNDELQKAIERVKAIGSTTDKTIPDWLEYGMVCNHDEGNLCEHRMEYLLSVIAGDPIPFKHTDILADAFK